VKSNFIGGLNRMETLLASRVKWRLVDQIEVALGQELHVVAASGRLKAELQTNPIHHE